MNKKMRRKLSNGLVVLMMVMTVTAVNVTTAFAAPMAAEQPIWIPILERILVIAGATLLLGVWQKWRERRNKKKE